jgi:hypothetical protein
MFESLVAALRKSYLGPMSKKTPPSRIVPKKDQDDYLGSLRVHKRVIESDTEDAPLPPGVTHVLVKKPGAKPELVTKRKSYF